MSKERNPRYVYVNGVGHVRMQRMIMKSYYYGVSIPQDVDADMVIGLFCGHIGESDWTNFTRPRMLSAGHEAMIYKVSLAVKPTDQTRIVDVFNALQFGDITIRVGADEFVNEPLCFFPVALYGEIAAREGDPLQRLAVSREIKDNIDEGERQRLMRALTGIAIPSMILESQVIDGDISLRKSLYGTPPFTLYVILHTVTITPLR